MGGACGTHRKMRNEYNVVVGKLKKKVHLRGSDVNWKVILKLMLKEKDMRMWAGFEWLRVMISGGYFGTMNFRVP